MLSMFAKYSCFYSGLSLATIESQYQCTFSGDQNTGHPITQTTKLLDLLASIYQIGHVIGQTIQLPDKMVWNGVF